MRLACGRNLPNEDAYWTGFDAADHEWQARIVSEGVAARLREDGAGVSLLVTGQDRIGLFADLVGVISKAGAHVVSAQVFTSRAGNVVDVFLLQGRDGTAFAGGEERRLDNLKDAVREVLGGKTTTPEIKTRNNRRAAAFLVEPTVQIQNDVSDDCTVIDIGGRDRPGLLYEIAVSLAEEELSINSAHIGSYGERVFNAFYVRDKTGIKVDLDARKASLHNRLLAALGRNEPDAPETPARILKRAHAADSF